MESAPFLLRGTEQTSHAANQDTLAPIAGVGRGERHKHWLARTGSQPRTTNPIPKVRCLARRAGGPCDRPPASTKRAVLSSVHPFSLEVGVLPHSLLCSPCFLGLMGQLQLASEISALPPVVESVSEQHLPDAAQGTGVNCSFSPWGPTSPGKGIFVPRFTALVQRALSPACSLGAEPVLAVECPIS